jgi:hypothetical protein
VDETHRKLELLQETFEARIRAGEAIETIGDDASQPPRRLEHTSHIFREFFVFRYLLSPQVDAGYVIGWKPSLINERGNVFSRTSWHSDTNGVVDDQIQCSAE